MPVRTLAKAWRSLGEPTRFGVAVSGGGDSIALLHAATELKARYGPAVTAIHVNHGLRTAAADEAEFCRARCDQLGVSFVLCELDAATWRGNVHDAARRARYQALADTAQRHELPVIFTAHTLDDQVETVLQRLLRGTGPTGLAGIRRQTGIFARPWLELRREQLRDFLRQRNLTWIEDPSNLDARYTRSRIRQTLVPAVREVAGEGGVVALARLATVADAERRVLDELATSDFAACATEDGLSVSILGSLSQGRRLLALRRWLATRALIPSWRTMQDIDHLVTAPGPGGPVRFADGLAVTRDYTTLRWLDHDARYEAWEPFSANQPCHRVFAGGRLKFDVLAPPTQVGPGDTLLDERDLAEATWRPPWPGARLSPPGLRGRIKCADLFINEKVPRALRAVWPLLTLGDKVLLVPGLRADRALRPARGRENSWVLRIEWL